jgi:hypothetical protein
MGSPGSYPFVILHKSLVDGMAQAWLLTNAAARMGAAKIHFRMLGPTRRRGMGRWVHRDPFVEGRVLPVSESLS